MNEKPESNDKLHQEILYYKKQLEQLSGESIRNDFVLSSLRHELRYVKNSFSALTSLQNDLTVNTSTKALASKALKSIISQLGFDKSIYLSATKKPGIFSLSLSEGFSKEEKFDFENKKVEIASKYLHLGGYLLFNKSSSSEETSSNLIKTFSINYFVGVPILDEQKPIAFLIGAQQLEKLPFYPPLDESNTNTLIAIANLIATVCQNERIMKLKLQKAEVDKRNKLIVAQRDKLKNTLLELRTTQKQLIHFEKMAFLGELTSGIAHEIQNPINFVINFSELGIDLLEEMRDELATTENGKKLFEITENLNDNLSRIHNHGRRADEIVKSMLLHSRANTGRKEMTDIHNLIEENLSLSYKSFNAKIKSLIVKLQRDFDPKIGRVKIVPQDIGRVFLNIFNNSFYSLREKQTSQEYEPTLSIRSRKWKDKIEITVSDNGLGILPENLGKVFQPFFTTKPPGQGTGLGLSLSFDIIANGHNGEISVDSKPNEYTRFSILLPEK